MYAITDRRTVAGLILVVLGLAVLAVEWFALSGAFVLGSIGAVFLVAYAFTRRFGFLVPGMILGFGAVGVGLQDSGYDPSGGLIAIAFGAGFLAIYLVDAFVRDGSRWWPLIPGTILVLSGTNWVGQGATSVDTVARLAPIALLITGVIVLVAAWRRAPTPDPTGS